MKSRVQWVLLLVLVWLVAACGWKTAPQTPPSPRPEMIREIKVVTRDAVAFFSWPIPTRNVEGRSMSQADIKGFRIDRAEMRRDRRLARFKDYAEIDMAAPASASIREGMVFWNDRDLKYNQIYRYRIRAISAKGGVSSWSEEVRVVPLLSLAVPKNVLAKAFDSYTVISWDPVTTRMDGSQYAGFVGFNIYRRTEDARYGETPVNSEPIRGNAYQDTEARNNVTYFYVVRAVDSPTQPWRESLDSNEVSAIPRDMTPPDRPSGFKAVAGIDRVFLTWNENKEGDLAGYHVYRSTRSGRDYQRLTDKPLLRSTYSDENIKTGATYYYVITAVDMAGNESARAAEKKAFVEELKTRFHKDQ